MYLKTLATKFEENIFAKLGYLNKIVIKTLLTITQAI